MRLGQWWKPRMFRMAVGVVTNLIDGEKIAFAQALHLAKQVRKGWPPLTSVTGDSWQVRIVRESFWTGAEVKDVMWQDGAVLISLKKIWKR